MDEIRLTELSVLINTWCYYTIITIYVNHCAEGYMHSREKVRDFQSFLFASGNAVFLCTTFVMVDQRLLC